MKTGEGERRVRRSSLAGRQSLIVIALLIVAVASALALYVWLKNAFLAGALCLLIMVPAVIYAVHRAVAPMLSTFRALSGAVLSYRDGDFAFRLRWRHNDELGDLVKAHNALGATLREQRMGLVERELLLDTMVQNTPVAMALSDAGGRVVYANVAARKLLNEGRRMEGSMLSVLLDRAPEALRQAVARNEDGLVAMGSEVGDEQDVYHLARRTFRLNGRRHELVLLRLLTFELRRQEVRTWKKVIRVISHELNNSLGPIASLAHSGAELVRRQRHDRLDQVFAGIEERARHLERFISGYARFAKLPAPRHEAVSWPLFLERLRGQVAFHVDDPIPEDEARLDPAQLEQALLNLLCNAHESGSPPEEVRLAIKRHSGTVAIEVSDRGMGMSDAVLANALLPFYSTKRGGTGLGLSLVREIAEAHGGRVALANRDGGGTVVTLTLPVDRSAASQLNVQIL